ncbi:hypothetical protein [Pseudofrankia inefficax]|uniref:Uncharacterized protein n=1 Tax=Pseudofrankia inefficax (strain DSM 45817 / CECT 9037 / DDB 130130 / EuI1c) TaxID=298654 RepID=E3J513_PSEI1|nr:hypothetical protein [Pseudofrankia inefficax]ADP79464.1 hypothetical protein FraEuI1c_1397 [Pseudofrankia inefficax]
MSDALLPAEFADLEPFAERWSLATEAARYATRVNSPMAEMEAFYAAAYPRVAEAMTYLDGFPLADLPDQQLNLLYLTYSLIMVSLPVEVWHQPRVIDSGTAYFDRYLEPTP